VSERTYTGESVAGEYHGPAVRRDLVGIESVLNAALQQRRQQLHDAGVGLADDPHAMDLMRAIEATVSIKDMTQRAAAGVVGNE
jgi:hypothetical protein